MKFLAYVGVVIALLAIYLMTLGAPQLAFGAYKLNDCKEKEMDYMNEMAANPLPRSKEILKERKRTQADIKECFESVTNIAKTAPLSGHSADRTKQ